jgi:hypothetical protein
MKCGEGRPTGNETSATEKGAKQLRATHSERGPSCEKHSSNHCLIPSKFYILGFIRSIVILVVLAES